MGSNVEAQRRALLEMIDCDWSADVNRKCHQGIKERE